MSDLVHRDTIRATALQIGAEILYERWQASLALNTELTSDIQRILMWATPIGPNYDEDTTFTEIRSIAREALKAVNSEAADA